MKKINIFVLFVYKQLMVLRFHWKSFCLIVTTLLGVQFLMLHFTYHPIEELVQYYDPEGPEVLNNGCLFVVEVGHKQTFYAPDTPEVVAFVEQICGSDLNIKIFSHRETMIKSVEECKERCDGIYFELPKSGQNTLQYTIYTNRMQIHTDDKYVTDSLDTSFSQSRDFKNFIKLQHSVDMNYITQVTNIQPDVSVEIGAMPFMRGGYFQNESGILFALMFPILFIILLETTFLVPLVEEKEDGLKEFLVIASPFSYLNGVTFYFVRLVIYSIYTIAILIMARLYNALGIIPATYAFILMFLFVLASMSYIYLISVFFNTVFYAKTFYLVILAHFAFVFIKGSIQKLFIRLFCTNAFVDAWNSFQIFGNKYAKFESAHLFEHLKCDSLSIFQIYCILLLQCLVYSLLYLYLTNILPGPGGIKKSLLFFIQPKYWKHRGETNEYECSNEATTDAIIVQDLEKQFKTSGRNILIANRLNMVIKNRQITVLLGHNGAGKTTTINMIMGLVPKDGGKIVVCSERDASCYRHLIGYCPQHSIYMQYMTCKQHLIFFAKLRGLCDQEAITLANKLLQQLNLTKKADEYAKNLSGGMKRRLSLGIAIAGETKIVILDEPSSGLDIESRRELWDILLELRKTKAILITTHHMEEAEVLGDTISILSNGRLQLTGSPLELKRKVGSGYILKLCTNPSQFNIDECLGLIRQHMPLANIINIVPPTVTISLPYEYKENYSKMLANLERQRLQLGINTISVTDTTLEDVFLNSVPKVETNDEIDGSINCHTDTNIRVPYQRLDTLKNVDLIQQFLAIAYKKLLFMKNEWFLALFLISVPFFMITIAVVTIHSSTVTKLGTGLLLSLNHYKEGIIYMSVPDEPSTNVLRLSELVQQQIESYPGFKVTKLALKSNYTEIENELIETMKKDFHNFQQNVLGSIQISGENRPTIMILHSENMMHSSAILTNLIDNAIYMLMANSKERILETIYAPVDIRDNSAGSLKLSYYATLLPFGMFFLMFYFAMLPFMENRSGFKRLQAMSTNIYWSSVLICDLMLLLLICAALYAFQIAIMPQELFSVTDIGHITVSLFFYGLTYLPIIYCLTNILTTLSALSICMAVLFYTSSIPPFIVSFTVADMLKFKDYIVFLRLLPDFNLCQQLRIINERFVNNHADHLPDRIRAELNSKEILDLGSFYFYVFLIFPLIMFIFLYVVENKRRRQVFSSLGTCFQSNSKSEQCPINGREADRFIQEEKSTVEKIIRDNGENEYPLIVHNLHKFFHRKLAVSDLNFVVRKKECFGLLGVNGAGKTTTFEMIAANQTISKGTIKIDGVDILLNEPEYRYRFGYCPQNDCLNDFMTAYQTLRYMALLRGIQTKHVRDEVLYWLEKLDLEKYENVQVKHYSGGTKRKLQTAAAMIGSPSLVLLDEPTTGVDPISRRFLWQSIQDFQKRDKTLVLTSHSMDECEYLCNRLAIMAEGQFKCLGYVPELKQLYGSGFTISIKLKISEASDADVAYVSEKLKHYFLHSKLRENHAGILTYFVKSSNNLVWSEVFSKCESFLNSTLDIIEEYSVNETTLEDIFLKYDTKNKRRSYHHCLENFSNGGGGDSPSIEEV